MPSDSLFSRTVDHATRVWPLAVVPLVVTLLDIGRIRTLLEPTPAPSPGPSDSMRVVVSEPDRLFNVSFGVPRPISTLWSFVNVQADGISTGAAGFDSLALFAVALLVSAVVSGLLAAGYLGSIDAALDGRFDFLAAVRSYGRSLVGFALLEASVGLVLVAAGIVAMPLVVVVAIALFGLAYLFFPTPYLVVVEERTLGSALGRSFELTTTEVRVLAFFVGYLVVSALLSVPISALAFAAEPVGLAVAILVSAPVALLLNVATLIFVRDLVADPSSNAAQSSSNIPVDM